MKIKINHEMIQSYMRLNGFDETLLAKKCRITLRQAHLLATTNEMRVSLSFLFKVSFETDLGTSYLAYLEPTTPKEKILFDYLSHDKK